MQVIRGPLQVYTGLIHTRIMHSKIFLLFIRTMGLSSWILSSTVLFTEDPLGLSVCGLLIQLVRMWSNKLGVFTHLVLEHISWKTNFLMSGKISYNGISKFLEKWRRRFSRKLSNYKIFKTPLDMWRMLERRELSVMISRP